MRRPALAPHVLVVAKSPVPGQVKTRLCPPLTATEAAEVAAAALADTLEAAGACGAGRRVLALDGAVGSWLPAGWRVVAQVGGRLDRRLTAAWAAAGGPGVQIGMDTPQVTPALLDDALSRLDEADAALGQAADGGWWAIVLRRPEARAFIGVPMSTPSTGASQFARLRRLGLDVATLPTLDDVDTVDDLRRVTSLAPWTRTAQVAARVLALVP